MDEDLKNICKNCEHITEGKYCESCGQRTSVNKVTFQETLNDLVDTLFTVNAPLLTTLRMLVINPGRLFTEYLGGKRKKYYRPVTFFILMTAIYLILRSLINFDPLSNTLLRVEDVSASQYLTKAGDFLLINIDKLLFVFALVLGMILIFFFNKFTFAEFLAISFYLTGIYTLLTTLNMFYIQYIDNSFLAFHLIVMLLYFVYALLSLFQVKKFLVSIKALLLFVLTFFSYGFIAFGLSFVIVLLKNN